MHRAIFFCSIGPAVPVPRLPDAVFADQGRGELRCHDQAEGVRPDPGEDGEDVGEADRRAHLPSRVLEGERNGQKCKNRTCITYVTRSGSFIHDFLYFEEPVKVTLCALSPGAILGVTVGVLQFSIPAKLVRAKRKCAEIYNVCFRRGENSAH